MSQRIYDYLSKHPVFLAIIVAVVALFLWRIINILIVIFLAYILMAALTPFVDFLVSKKVPRSLASIICYLLVIAFFLVLILPLIPFLLAQVQQLLISFPEYLHQTAKLFKLNFNQSQLNDFFTSRVGIISENAFAVTSRFLTLIFSFLTVIILSLYMMVDYEKIKKYIVNLFPENLRIKVSTILTKTETKMGLWLRGQIILSLSIGIFSYIAYTLINLKFALPLALLAGIFEIVPNIGPIIGATGAVIVALTISPALALTVVVVYVLIQILEANLLVPIVMEKSVGLHPLVIILAIIIGGELMGLKGILLSVPFISFLAVVLQNI